MSNKEFNLIDEKWIRVLTKDYQVIDMSITDVMLHADEYLALAGETGTQDVALLRTLLALVHTIFTRVDVGGNPVRINQGNAIQKWKELYELGHFPEKPVMDYLEENHEKFWLFHPEYPLFQVPAVEKDGECLTAAKLNGSIMQSGNSIRFNSCRSGKERDELTYAEAARWLITINSFDDASVKCKTAKKLPPIGVAWCGKLGNIMFIGENLFETLMLNLPFLKDGEKTWGKDQPIWEKPINATERRQIACPDNMAEILTLQSRKIILCRENGRVTGFKEYGGDIVNTENAFTEQMTVWGKKKDKNAGTGYFYPMPFKATNEAWDSMVFYISEQNGQKMPGIVKWVQRLQDEEAIPDDMILSLRLVSARYDVTVKASMSDIYDDTVVFPSSILSSAGDVWQKLILDEVHRIDQRADAIGDFEEHLLIASGIRTKVRSERIKQEKNKYYMKINTPFRRLLSSIHNQQSEEERNKIMDSWSAFAHKTTVDQANDMARKAGNKAFIGLTDSKTQEHYCTPKGLNLFFGNLNKAESM